MNPFSSIPNIGKVLADKLVLAGIDSPETLRKIGAEKAFAMLKVIDPASCISSLYAIEGAIQDIRWHNLTKERKAELLEYFNSSDMNCKSN
jgi:DNA transformation protein